MHTTLDTINEKHVSSSSKTVLRSRNLLQLKTAVLTTTLLYQTSAKSNSIHSNVLVSLSSNYAKQIWGEKHTG